MRKEVSLIIDIYGLMYTFTSTIYYYPVRKQSTSVEEAGIRHSEHETSQPQTIHWRLHKHCSTSERSTFSDMKKLLQLCSFINF